MPCRWRPSCFACCGSNFWYLLLPNRRPCYKITIWTPDVTSITRNTALPAIPSAARNTAKGGPLSCRPWLALLDPGTLPDQGFPFREQCLTGDRLEIPVRSGTPCFHAHGASDSTSDSVTSNNRWICPSAGSIICQYKTRPLSLKEKKNCVRFVSMSAMTANLLVLFPLYSASD